MLSRAVFSSRVVGSHAQRLRHLAGAQSTSIQSERHQSSVRTEKRGDVGVVKIDIPGVKENVLNEQLVKELPAAFEKFEKDDAVKAIVVISGKPNSFVAGADINLIKKAGDRASVEQLARAGQDQFARITASKKPVVAAIMGSCMGGGLELALACHYRIAVNDGKTQLALPEVLPHSLIQSSPR